MNKLSQRRMTYREMVIARKQYERRRLREEYALLHGDRKDASNMRKRSKKDREHEHAV